MKIFFESFEDLSVVPSYHELVAQLREQGLYVLSALSQRKWLWAVSVLVCPHRCLGFYLTGTEKI